MINEAITRYVGTGQMMPIGPLMIEHRLIERAIKQMRMEIDQAKTRKRFDVGFIDSWIDFIRTYADQVHHGKEERILFHDLANRPLSPALKLMMEGLIEDHVRARKMVGELISARNLTSARRIKSSSSRSWITSPRKKRMR
jgi:hemerythrin-like domain-containing protein